MLAPVFAAGGAWFGARLERESAARSAKADNPALASPPAILPSLAPLVQRVGDSVVRVRTVHRLDDPVAEGGTQWEPDVSRGTGFVIHANGLVLTARHVVAEPALIAVELSDGSRCEAKLVGEDPSTDLAVIRLVDPPEPLAALEFGSSEDVHQGDWVMSIGNPLSFRQSVGVGVVSYVGRHLVQDGMGVTNDYLQVSMPMYPGTSGSPIFDLEGRVIGITTRAASAAEGLSFAVSARMVRRVLDSMERNQGRARRAFLGIQFTPLDPGSRARIGIASAGGVLVTGVDGGRPAAVAGVRVGDVIVSFDGRPVQDVHELHDWITWSQPDREVELGVLRDGQHVEHVKVRLSELPT